MSLLGRDGKRSERYFPFSTKTNPLGIIIKDESGSTMTNLTFNDSSGRSRIPLLFPPYFASLLTNYRLCPEEILTLFLGTQGSLGITLNENDRKRYKEAAIPSKRRKRKRYCQNLLLWILNNILGKQKREEEDGARALGGWLRIGKTKEITTFSLGSVEL